MPDGSGTCSGELAAFAKVTLVSGAATWNQTTLDEPPPGPGFTTVTAAVPALATSVGGTVAVRCSRSTNVVARGAPLKLMVAPETNPVPLAVRVNPEAPGETAVGISGWFSRGTGLPGVAVGLIWILKKPSIANAPVASVTVTSKYQVPPPVGVPLIVPLPGLSSSPSGTAPPTSYPVMM